MSLLSVVLDWIRSTPLPEYTIAEITGGGREDGMMHFSNERLADGSIRFVSGAWSKLETRNGKRYWRRIVARQGR